MSNQDEQKGEWRVKYRAGFHADAGSDTWEVHIPSYKRSPLVVYDRDLAESLVSDHAEVARLRAALDECDRVIRRLHAVGDNHGRPCQACAAAETAAALRGEDA